MRIESTQPHIPTTPTPNYLLTFREFIAEFLSLSTKIAETDRQKIDTLKRQYLEATSDAATSLRNKGFYDILFSVAGLATYTLRVFTKSELDLGLIELTTRELLPSAKNLFQSRIDALARQTEARQFMLGNEHQAKASNHTDTGKQDFLSALNQAYQAIKV